VLTETARPPTDSATAFDSAWEAFFRAVRHARGRAARAEHGALTLPQYHLLDPLASVDALPVGVLADEAGVAAPTATKMLDGLVRAGLVERASAPHDRRVVLIRLTGAGHEALAAKRERVKAVRAEIHAQLSETERNHAAALLRRLAGIVEDL
jgi:MarR family transcriptional regulator, organic hydroperoxide resistance regulator